MKKIFIAIMAAAAILTVSACDNDGGKGGKKAQDNFKGIVTIDGEFDDWKLDTQDLEGAVYLSCPQNSASAAIQNAVFAGDERYIYVYFEYKITEGNMPAYVDIFVDTDCKANVDEETGDETLTGGGTWLWADGAGYEMLVENAPFLSVDEAGNYVIDDFSGAIQEKYIGIDGKDAWDADNVPSPGKVGVPGSGFAAGAGKVVDGVALVEFSVLRDRLEIDGPKVRMGIFTMYGEGWDDDGHLPQPMAEGQPAEFAEFTVPVDED